MWFDRDIDSRMRRTCWRPLPGGQVNPTEALILGLALSIGGVLWAFVLAPAYALVVFAGIFFDVVVYTIWLKRRSSWSIIWGGIAGAMPVLSGRVLALGTVDWVGLTLALAVLFWIPTHILTFNIRNFDDYQAAAIPTFPAVYGIQTTRLVISISSILAAISMGIAAFGVGLTWGYLRLLLVLSAGLLLLAIGGVLHPSERVNFGLFKYASIFMLAAMLLLVFTAL
jgi:protoheme IX farnesyltransferase